LLPETFRDIARYKNFLGLNNADDYKREAAVMKRRGDFTSLGVDAAAIEATRAAGMPADRVLSLNHRAEAEVAAR